MTIDIEQLREILQAMDDTDDAHVSALLLGRLPSEPVLGRAYLDLHEQNRKLRIDIQEAREALHETKGETK